jgi:hypothetical protein
MPNNGWLASSGAQSTNWKIILKTISAFLAAAVAPSIVFFAICLWRLFSNGELYNNIIGCLFFTVFAFVVAIVHIVVLGLPAFLWGWRHGLIHWWSTLIIAFIIGATPTIFVFLPNGLIDYTFPVAAIMGLFGVIGGFAFWLVWRFLPLGKTKEIRNTAG